MVCCADMYALYCTEYAAALWKHFSIVFSILERNPTLSPLCVIRFQWEYFLAIIEGLRLWNVIFIYRFHLLFHNAGIVKPSETSLKGCTHKPGSYLNKNTKRLHENKDMEVRRLYLTERHNWFATSQWCLVWCKRHWGNARHQSFKLHLKGGND